MTNENGKWPLPEGWVWTTLGEVTNPERERVQPLDFPHLPFVGMDDITSQTMQLLGTKPASEMRSAAEHFRPDDVLYGSLRPYLNKVYRPDFEGLSSAEFIVFRRVPHLQSKYLQYFLNQWSFVEFINRQNTGDRPRVKFNQMADYPFPLPPLPTQHHIVAEIEKQFTRLDAAVAALRRAKANLARYKAAVLKAAVEGRLVARPQRSSETSEVSASVLLQRILAERRARWEAANPKKQYVEPKRPNVDGLGELPEGWVWASIDQVTQIIDYRGRTPPYSDNGIPHLRSFNVKDGIINWEGITYVTEETYDKYMTRGLPKSGDVLFTTEAPLGEVALAPVEVRFSIAQRMMILRPANGIDPKFLVAQIRGPYFQSAISQRGTGTTVTGVSSRNFRPTAFALPPLNEQLQIGEELGRRLSVIQSTEQAIDANLARAERLRQAVLARAFRGELVIQDVD